MITSFVKQVEQRLRKLTDEATAGGDAAFYRRLDDDRLTLYQSLIDSRDFEMLDLQEAIDLMGLFEDCADKLKVLAEGG